MVFHRKGPGIRHYHRLVDLDEGKFYILPSRIDRCSVTMRKMVPGYTTEVEQLATPPKKWWDWWKTLQLPIGFWEVFRGLFLCSTSRGFQHHVATWWVERTQGLKMGFRRCWSRRYWCWTVAFCWKLRKKAIASFQLEAVSGAKIWRKRLPYFRAKSKPIRLAMLFF